MDTFLGFDVGIPKIALYGSIILLIAALIVVQKNKKRLKDYKKFIASLILAEFLFLILGITVIFRTSVGYYRFFLKPYFNYQEIFETNNYYDVWEIYLNIALFIPIGFVLNYIYGVAKLKKCLLTCVCISLSIEILQLLLQKGLCETNDVLHNTLGAVIGMAVFMIIIKVKQTIKLIKIWKNVR